MSDNIDDKRLHLLAIQLDSIRVLSQQSTFLQRGRWRFKKEFLGGSFRDRIRFLNYTFRQILLRTNDRLAARREMLASRRRQRGCRREFPSEGLRVAAVCEGGMGDIAIESAFLDRFSRESGCPLIHVIVRPLRMEEANFIFHDSPSVDAVLSVSEVDLQAESTPYDVVLKMGDFVSYAFVREEKVRRLAPELLDTLTTARQIQRRYRNFIDVTPAFDGLFASMASKSGLRRLDVLGWLGNVPFTQDHQLHLAPNVAAYRRFTEDLRLTGKKYITIHNGWDKVALHPTDTVTKAWPEEHFERFVDQFKARRPDVLVVQLGAVTSQPIKNVDLCLLNDTSLDEAAWVLKHSLLHVDGDSGLVHLARALHTKSLALFGPTNHEFFRYAQNDTLSSTTCNNCWYTHFNWVRSCPRGLEKPECMASIDPATVLDRAERHLSSLPDVRLKIENFRPYPGTENESNSGTGMSPRHHPPSFAAWRDDYIGNVLKSMEVSGEENGATAILNEAESEPCRISGTKSKPTAFCFGSSGAIPPSPDQPSVGARRGAGGEGFRDNNGPHPNPLPKGEGTIDGQPRDFGSFHNIPAENEAYDVVVLPSLTERVRFPYFAIKESLRILKENGVLILAFDLPSGRTRDGDCREGDAVDAFFRALERLGVEGDLVRSSRGGIVVRKMSSCKDDRK